MMVQQAPRPHSSLWDANDCFPWVVYSGNQVKRLNLELLEEILGKVDQHALNAHGIFIFDGKLRGERLKHLERLGEEDFEGAFTEALIALTVIGFRSETFTEKMPTGMRRERRQAAVTNSQLLERVMQRMDKILAKPAKAPEPFSWEITDMTDDEKMQGALGSGGESWWKGSGKGWAGQWHRS